MIFFGSRGKVVRGTPVGGFQCPSCTNAQFVTFGIIRYFHLYWIPFFPTSKKVGIECTHCKLTLVGNEISPQLVKLIENNIFKKQDIIPMFTWVIIFSLLIVLATSVAIKDHFEESSYIKHPSANDLYIVNFTKIFDDADKEYKYGILKINNVSGENVEFVVGNMVYKHAYDVSKEIKDGKPNDKSYYDIEPIIFSSKQLSDMKENGAIYSIERN